MEKTSGEFGEDEISALSNCVNGRIIQSIELCDGRGLYDALIFTFTSGSKLRVEYDYLYGWEVIDPL